MPKRPNHPHPHSQPHRHPNSHHPPSNHPHPHSQPHRHPNSHHPPSNHPHPHPHSQPHRHPTSHHPPPNHPRSHPHPNNSHHPPPLSFPPPTPQRRPSKAGRTTLASCIVATIFLIFLLIILFILYFSLFKPTDPKLTLTSIQLPTFSLSHNSTLISFTFSVYAAVRNPNRAQFSHFDSSLQLLYAGNQLAFMFIPAGVIPAGKTDYIAATFSVQSFPTPKEGFPVMIGPPVISDGIDRVRATMEFELRMEMVGRVRVLWFFSHHVGSIAFCRVAVAINDGSVLGFHC